jgi:hypothetical protein
MDYERGEDERFVEGGGLSQMTPAIDAHIEFEGDDGNSKHDTERDLNDAVKTIVFLVLRLKNAESKNRNNEGHSDDYEIQDEVASAVGNKT